MFERIKAADTDGKIANLYPFVWRVAQNVYADFFDRRRRRAGALTPPEVGVGAEDCRMSVAKYFSDWGCGKRPQPQRI